MESIDLTSIEDMLDVVNYYAVCGAYVGYMLEKFGHNKVMQLFKNWTYESIQNVLGVTRHDITRGYKTWVKENLNL